MQSLGPREVMIERRVSVNDGAGNHCIISAELARDLKIEHYIDGESHPAPQYADEEKIMEPKYITHIDKRTGTIEGYLNPDYMGWDEVVDAPIIVDRKNGTVGQ